MSCCGGNCGCDSHCNCGTACAGCKMSADLTYTENPAQGDSGGLVSGVAPHTLAEAADNGGCGGCKCGSDCKCDPCHCN